MDQNPSRKEPRKPTVPFGVAVFSDDGKVRRDVSKLSEVKSEQEIGAVAIFADHLKRFHGIAVSAPEPLPQNDHDAVLIVNGQRVRLQVTEISPREFELPAGSVCKGSPKSLGFWSAISPQAKSLDVDCMNGSVLRAIERKLARNYPNETERLWLLIFTTSPFIMLESSENGELKIGEPLKRVREAFASRPWRPFDEVWFTNLITRPVRALPA